MKCSSRSNSNNNHEVHMYSSLALCRRTHGRTSTLSDCAFFISYRNRNLQRAKHIPKVTELVEGGPWVHAQATGLLAAPVGEASLGPSCSHGRGFGGVLLVFCLKNWKWIGSKSPAAREDPDGV